MWDEKLVFVSVYLASVMISSISQVMLKIAAERAYGSKHQEYLNPLVLTAYGLFFGTTLLTMLALRHIPLSTGAILESTGYVFVGVLSYIILREDLNRKKLLGMITIIAGVIIFSL